MDFSRRNFLYGAAAVAAFPIKGAIGAEADAWYRNRSAHRFGQVLASGQPPLQKPGRRSGQAGVDVFSGKGG